MAEMNVINKKSSSGYMGSIVFLVIVVASTVWLNMYNNYLTTEIEGIQKSISSYETNISEVESDENIKIYSLLEINKWVIGAYEKMNKVTTYINHMIEIEDEYNIKLTWFDLSKWIITTNIQSLSNDDFIAYQKTRDFIKKYRADWNWLFNLGFINSVEWMDIMKFKVKFKIN